MKGETKKMKEAMKKKEQAYELSIFDILKSLVLKRKIPHEEKNELFENVSFMAIEDGKLDLLKFLVTNGANVNDMRDSDYDKSTPLHEASKKGRYEIV